MSPSAVEGSRSSSKRGFGAALHRPSGFVAAASLMAALLLWRPDVGLLSALVYVLFVSWLSEPGPIRFLGLGRPSHWIRMAGVALLLAAAIHFPVDMVLTPLVEYVTGRPVDVSAFDILRGSATSLLIVLPIVWLLAAFGEEVVFRGFLMKQTAARLGGGAQAWWIGLALSTTLFGLAHLYQGVSGVILTGTVGFALGFIFLKARGNLWLPIFVHGFIDTIGLTAIYLDVDRQLNEIFKHWSS